MEKFTQDEMNELIAWAIGMAKFWIVSALLYVAIFNGSAIAMWIIGSIVVLEVKDYWFEAREKDIDNDTDN